MPKAEFLVVNPGLGLNSLISDTLIKDTEASDLLNIEFVESGCPAKRRGSVQVGNTTGSRIFGGGSIYTSSLRETLRVNGTKLEKLSGSSWAEVSGATFSSLNTNMVQAKGFLYFHNGTDNMQAYDGAVTAPSTGVKGSFGVYYAGRHIVIGNPSFPSRLYISNPNNPSDFTGSSGTATAGSANTLTDSTKTWGVNDFSNQTVAITQGTGAGQSRVIASNTATALTVATNWNTNPDSTSVYTIATGNYIDISKDDGDKLTAVGRYQDKLIVCKEKSTYQLTFDSSGLPTVTPVIIGTGCVSARSMVNVENDLYFAFRNGSEVGIKVLGNEPNYFNVIRTNTLSARVAPEFATVVMSNLEKSSAIYFDNKYIISIPQGGTTTNNAAIAYDRRYTAWSKWTGFSANSFWTFTDSSNIEHLYFGDDTAGKTWELLKGYNDGGTAINAYWVSKNFDFRSFYKRKKIYPIYMLFRSILGQVKVELIIDGDTTIKNINLGVSSTSSRGIGTDLIADTIVAQDGSVGGLVASTTKDQVVMLKINKPGMKLKIKVSNDTVDETFTLLEFGGTTKTTKAKLPSSNRY